MPTEFRRSAWRGSWNPGHGRIAHDEVNAADYNGNWTLDANAARAKTAISSNSSKTANQVD